MDQTIPTAPITPPTRPGGRPTLRRARKERILFGVCGGLARYVDMDPTLVRVAVVLIGLIPPLGGTLVIAYIAMTLIVPEEGAEPLPGREQVKENLTGLRSEIGSLRDEVAGLAETIRARVTGQSPAAGANGAATPAAEPAADATAPTAAPTSSPTGTTKAAA